MSNLLSLYSRIRGLPAGDGDTTGAIETPGKVPQLLLAVAGAAVILFSTAAIARLMDWMPSAPAASTEARADDEPEMTVIEAPVRAGSRNRVKTKCAGCGTVVSIRELEHRQAAGASRAEPALATPVTSSPGCEITIHLRDGTKRVIVDANPAAWRIGERVIIIDTKTMASR